MSQSTVYFVETSSGEQRLVLCDLTQYFYEHGKRVQVLADSSLAARNLDQLLWTFSQESFIPHRVLTVEPRDKVLEPVIITVGELHLEGTDHLVCDSPSGLDFVARYVRSVHFILNDDADRKQESRLFWQACADRGIGRIHVPYRRRGQARWLEIIPIE